jgi:hypothetical protein
VLCICCLESLNNFIFVFFFSICCLYCFLFFLIITILTAHCYCLLNRRWHHPFNFFLLVVLYDTFFSFYIYVHSRKKFLRHQAK